MGVRIQSEGPVRGLRYAMVGGGANSFIGPVHRAALRMDDLAEYFPGPREGVRSMRFVEAALVSAKRNSCWVRL